jgi:hypothetical protein
LALLWFWLWVLERSYLGAAERRETAVEPKARAKRGRGALKPQVLARARVDMGVPEPPVPLKTMEVEKMLQWRPLLWL